MKNSNLFPFERNQYFYGKLLSVDDFELEQKYGNDKRRMINRFVCGTGIIAGLGVVRVDERTISVETGCALDAFGREIAVDTPVIRKLSLIDGFESCADVEEGCIYLCLEYSEEGTSPVHNLTGGVANGQQTQYSRIREGYRLYLTGQAPEELNLSCDSLYEETVRLFSGQGVTVTQTLPRYARVGDEIELRVEVENVGQPYVSFTYELELTCLESGGKRSLTVSFDEMMFEKTGRYTMTYPFKVLAAADTEGTAALKEGSFKLYAARQPIQAAASGCSSVWLTRQDARQELIDQYHRQAMENLMKNVYREPLYLARIYLVKAGGSCIIERVENVPFRQYVMNNYLSGALLRLMIREGAAGHGAGAAAGHGSTGQGESGGRLGVRMQTGEVTFDLSRGAQRGQRFFSKEIFHGLGFGSTAIWTGLKEEKEEVVFGSAEVFEDQKLRAEVAVRSFEDKGSFVIGIRLLESVGDGMLTVRWTAVRNVDEELAAKVEKKIFIKPGILELGLRESRYLETSCVNMSDRRVRWSVQENGGFVDENGCYTAPNVAGVYEVTAESVADPEVRASIFVVVREEDGSER